MDFEDNLQSIIDYFILFTKKKIKNQYNANDSESLVSVDTPNTIPL